MKLSQKNISDLFNFGYTNPMEGLLEIFFPDLVIKKYYKLLTQLNDRSSNNTHSLTLKFEKFKTSNQTILEIQKELSSIEINLTQCLIHGSYATHEEIEYSDFDGLIIINKNTFSSFAQFKKTIDVIKKTNQLILKLDPLQHHGWFILLENDLNNYDETFLPVDVLNISKSLLLADKSDLKIYLNEKSNFNLGIDRLSKQLLDKINSKNYPTNCYQIKSLLSEFMMLPTLYYQAKEKKGIYKKYSFKMVKNDFSSSWTIMDKVSLIRTNWSKYFIKNELKITHNNYLTRYLFKKYNKKASANLLSILSNEFYSEMKALIIEMRSKLNLPV
jgi:predicted nucleotidyltransferase